MPHSRTHITLSSLWRPAPLASCRNGATSGLRWPRLLHGSLRPVSVCRHLRADLPDLVKCRWLRGCGDSSPYSIRDEGRRRHLSGTVPHQPAWVGVRPITAVPCGRWLLRAPAAPGEAAASVTRMAEEEAALWETRTIEREQHFAPLRGPGPTGGSARLCCRERGVGRRENPREAARGTRARGGGVSGGAEERGAGPPARQSFGPARMVGKMPGNESRGLGCPELQVETSQSDSDSDAWKRVTVTRTGCREHDGVVG